ncbi:hypothetical protein PILCRDRAFT_12941 [Piloderma croceum F 1598]|uniref:non-specific serine/threonine protein kinase n=1 Tax=Piloderma croceum (strain F 1598) TaxID=765440 RepID=A0A0C3F8K2_PILCF|nr:hypothetical protein PILCRDRAFT_12941 [Piloderma croceum F 1598]
MSLEHRSSSPNRALLALAPVDPNWRPIFHASNQVVLYNPTSHAISIQESQFSRHHNISCPYCKQPLPGADLDSDLDGEIDPPFVSDSEFSRASNYFQLLAIANETSRPSTPLPHTDGTRSTRRSSAFSPEAMADGYFKAFFQEEYRLGMGAYGSVYLCQHMLDGNPLGHFAVKKIAVGESHTYLLQILREVRLLERLHHPNIITYHHAWLESSQFSAFGPKVPTLQLSSLICSCVLMQWAEGGSLDDFIDIRLGHSSRLPHIHLPSSSSHLDQDHPNSDSSSSATTPTQNNPDLHSRSARIRAFRAFQRAPPDERERLRADLDGQSRAGGRNRRPSWKAVHLMSAEEVRSLFGDIVEGLAFLHDKSILHLDLKPGNVLLTWDEDRLIPRAMLSDFGTSRDMLHPSRARSGNTGTLEYTSPESLPSLQTGLLQQIDSKADMWSLGMILHKILFFRLPYQYAADDGDEGNPGGINEGDKMAQLEQEIQSYSGFKPSATLGTTFGTRRLPRAYIVLLESLLNVNPFARPTCDRVLSAIRERRLDPVTPDLNRNAGTLVPASQDSPSNIPDAADQRGTAEIDAAHISEKEAIPPLFGQQAPLLRLLAPPRVSVDRTGNISLWTPSVGNEFGIMRVLVPKTVWVKMLKSCMLVAKIMTIRLVCHGSYPRPVVMFFVFFVAVTDTWFDGLRISVILAIFHVAFFRIGFVLDPSPVTQSLTDMSLDALLGLPQNLKDENPGEK